MNNDRAKFILRSYRASGEDARDPVFAEALEQAERDPELKAWLASERKFDQIITGKLQAVPVPLSLRNDILAAANATTSQTFWKRSRILMAVAASLLVLAGGLWAVRLFPEPTLSLSTLPDVASSFLSRPFLLDKMAVNEQEVVSWLQSKPSLPEVEIPEEFQHLVSSGVGCRSFTWRGQNVVLLCFTLLDGRPAHFFVMDARSLPDAAGSGQPQIGQHGNWITTTWVKNNQAFVLATSGTIQDAIQAL